MLSLQLPLLILSKLVSTTMLEALSELLPQQPGLLPYFLLYVSAAGPHALRQHPPLAQQTLRACAPYSRLCTYISSQTVFAGLAHTIVCFVSSPQASMIPFQGTKAPPPTRLMAHIYGIKTFYTILIRFITAYRLPDSFELYCLCWFTFLGVFVLYSTEWLLYSTVRRKEVVIPLLTSSLGMIWMWLEKDYYCASV